MSCLAIVLAEWRRSAGIHTATAQCIQEIPHVQALTDVVFGVAITVGLSQSPGHELYRQVQT